MKNKFSFYTYFLCITVMFYAGFSFYPRWKQTNTEAEISWDVSGYYWYLPSVFIFHDLKHQSFHDSIINHYQPTPVGDFQQAFKVDNGNYVMKYSSGMAVMYAPFFTVAHIAAKPLGYPQDGFSAPYQFMIHLGGFLMAILGLWYLRKLLLLFYSDAVTTTVMLCLVIGTNYLNYSAIDTGMSHSWLFTLYVFLILNTINFYQSPKLKYALRIGFLVGLATLVRPTEIISSLIPLFWGLQSVSKEDIRQHFSFLSKNIKLLFIAFVCAAIVISVQLFYWKYVSGHWLVYSYQDQGFSWRHPHAKIYAFNYKSGWLTYCPMMILAFVGIIPFLKNGKNKVAILIFIVLNYYIVSAWDIWWYGGRAMIQSYPLMLFPFAALIDTMFRKKVLKWLLIPVLVLLSLYNTWVIYIYHAGNVYDTDCMTKGYFWHVIGRTQLPDERFLALKDNADLFEGTMKDQQLIYTNDFENDTTVYQQTIPAIDGNKSLIIDKTHSSPEYNIPLSHNGAQWVRFQAKTHCLAKEWNVWKMTQMIVRFKKGNDLVKERMIRMQRFLSDNETKNIEMDVRIPKEDFDHVTLSFWNANSEQTVQIDDLKLWSFQE